MTRLHKQPCSKQLICLLIGGALVLLLMKRTFLGSNVPVHNVRDHDDRGYEQMLRMPKISLTHAMVKPRTWFEKHLSSIRGSTELKPAPLVAEGPDVVSVASVEVSVFKQSSWQKSETCLKIARSTYEDDFVRLPLMSPVGRMPVYIHEPAMDGISNRVYKQRKFEPRILELILLFVLSEDDINFIDVGANIGLHTLPVLKVGRKVLSFEAVPTNVQHICMSAHDLRFHANVKVIHNAVGADHTPSNFVLGRNGTYGDNFVDVPNSDIRKNKMNTDIGAYSKHTVPMPTVMIDDLLTWPDNSIRDTFKKNFYKIDVEGSEAKVLEGAVEFLKATSTVGIIMEWRWHRGQKSGKVIYNILTQLDFEPFDPAIRDIGAEKPIKIDFHDIFTRQLNYEKSALWPHDVVWIPKHKPSV